MNFIQLNQMMDAFILYDILEQRDYLEWTALINEVNKEYHDEYYWDWYLLTEALICQRCDYVVYNWRLYSFSAEDKEIYRNKKCYNKGLREAHDFKAGLLPKNYWFN